MIGPDAIHIEPCGHTYDAIAMETIPHPDEVDSTLDVCPHCDGTPAEFELQIPEELKLHPCGHIINPQKR